MTGARRMDRVSTNGKPAIFPERPTNLAATRAARKSLPCAVCENARMTDWLELTERLQRRFDASPLHAFYRFRIVGLREDAADLHLPFQPEYDNGAGNIHGGILAMLADTAIACALSTRFGGRMGFATSNLNVHFLRRARTAVVAHASVVKVGGTVCVARVEIRDENDEAVAIASADFVLTSLRGAHAG